jgi:competence protein ComEA
MYRLYRFMYGVVGFSRSQTNGFLIFLPLVLLITFSEPMYRRWKASQLPDHSSDIRKLDSLVALLGTAAQVKQDSDTGNLTIFDPNTGSAFDLARGGLPSEVVSRIIKYRAKGGQFRKREDLLKIYGMDTTIYSLVAPYIRIVEPTKVLAKRREPEREKNSVASRKLRIDINKADTAELKKVFGVGEKLSMRILKYRNALGGFISMDQLREVYKLDSVVVRHIRQAFFIAPDFSPARLDVNTAGRQDLAAHPYLSAKVADAIVAHRFQHGEFRSIEEFRKIPVLDSILIRKIEPYLKFPNP